DVTPSVDAFIGLWYNIKNQDEEWIFYDNGTYFYKNIEFDPFTHEPYLFSIWSTYYLKDSEVCFKDQDAPHDQPSICYNYEFSNNDTMLNICIGEIILFTLTKELG
ncbi:MAG: hypothetical protein QCI00_08925, partial [Candidatus Thermoplasmatota archaeon]|nr:hypothetical protein [Candidatus Thermoplasmatota archaeon]